ncbi:hypothetical protein GCM10010129_38790 [Streptomyces fumigatiscleroticus]|nr:hypothetical protein GCM10010129_38790 [Streptomyces fumigatiscleroticus]
MSTTVLLRVDFRHWDSPTTVLAMVDVAVGGKTGINTTKGKNLEGTPLPLRPVAHAAGGDKG